MKENKIEVACRIFYEQNEGKEIKEMSLRKELCKIL